MGGGGYVHLSLLPFRWTQWTHRSTLRLNHAVIMSEYPLMRNLRILLITVLWAILCISSHSSYSIYVNHTRNDRYENRNFVRFSNSVLKIRVLSICSSYLLEMSFRTRSAPMCVFYPIRFLVININRYSVRRIMPLYAQSQ